MSDPGRIQTVLLTGATGFVGSHLYPALRAAGYEVRCASRDPRRASAAYPDRQWVRLDVEDPSSFAEALAGCGAAYYLVHSIETGGDYPAREAQAAMAVRQAAEAAGIRRLVYLGGVSPSEKGSSRHLRSRLRTGEILREGSVPTFELRAAMVIGHGGVSWQMVRDLAARLPAMLLPRWLQNHSWPVDIQDVVYALLGVLSLPGDDAGWYDVPGAERVSHREMLMRVAAALGNKPVMFGVPVLTPRLSSYWIAIVTRADLTMAAELVEGLRTDLDPSGTVIWELLGDRELVSLDDAIRGALDDERLPHVTLPTRRMRERLEALAVPFREERS